MAMENPSAPDRLFDEFSPSTPESWRTEAELLLRGASYDRRLRTRTLEGITLEPIYGAAETGGLEQIGSLPGSPPYLRGAKPLREGTALAEEAACDGLFAHARLGEGGLPRLGLCVAAADRSGVERVSLRGSVAVDPIGEILAAGSIPMPLEGALDEMAAMTAWAAGNAPGVGTIGVHGEVFHNGGAHTVQDLAFSLATALYYLRAMEERGIVPERAAPRVRFSFALGGHFFMEVARLRAARLLWDRALDACGVPGADRVLAIHGCTSERTAARYDPHVNMLRATTQALSGLVGGVDSLHVAPFDNLSRPGGDDFSRRIARNTQIILEEEAHFAWIADPAGGSWYVERLTDEVARAAWDLFRKVEKRGGMGEAVKEGFPQDEVARTAAARADAAARGRKVMVGTNRYPNPTDRPLSGPDDENSSSHGARPDPDRSESLPVQVNGRVPDPPTENGFCVLAAALIDAARGGATAGALCATLPTRRGAPARARPIPLRRTAEPFERLRFAVEEHRRKGGGAKVFLAGLVPAGRILARLDFAAAFFEAGGFEVIRDAGHEGAGEAASAAAAHDAQVVVICGRDEDYPAGASNLAAAVRKRRPETIVALAGKPASPEEAGGDRAEGVDVFVHAGADMLTILNGVARRLGVES